MRSVHPCSGQRETATTDWLLLRIWPVFLFLFFWFIFEPWGCPGDMGWGGGNHSLRSLTPGFLSAGFQCWGFPIQLMTLGARPRGRRGPVVLQGTAETATYLLNSLGQTGEISVEYQLLMSLSYWQCHYQLLVSLSFWLFVLPSVCTCLLSSVFWLGETEWTNDKTDKMGSFELLWRGHSRNGGAFGVWQYGGSMWRVNVRWCRVQRPGPALGLSEQLWSKALASVEVCGWPYCGYPTEVLTWQVPSGSSPLGL